MKRNAAITTVTIALAGAAVGAYLLRDGVAARPAASQPLRIVFTAEMKGELEPCNCGGAMAGGLPAVGAYVDGIDQPHLVVDTGNVTAGARAFEQLALRAALRGMAHIGYDAINVGRRELWLGAADLRACISDGAPFVSANVTATTGATVATDHLRIERAGRTIVITGVVDHQAAQVGEGLAVAPPAEALARLVPQWAGDADMIVVLADLPQPRVAAIAQALPEIDLILFGGEDATALQVVNRTQVMAIQGETRFVGDVTVGPDVTGRAIELRAELGESQAVRDASIGWYKDQLRGRTFDLAERRLGSALVQPFTPTPGNGYVGSEACRACHADTYAQWSATSHARAMDSLQRVAYDFAPECIVCHVVGYGAADGYQSMEATPHLGRVGCESCHGPGRILLDGNCRGKARRGDASTCTRCHNPRKDPTFSFELDWPKVAHGASP